MNYIKFLTLFMTIICICSTVSAEFYKYIDGLKSTENINKYFSEIILRSDSIGNYNISFKNQLINLSQWAKTFPVLILTVDKFSIWDFYNCKYKYITLE